MSQGEDRGTPHAIFRAKESLGIDINVGTLHEWAYLIRNGHARLVKHHRSGCDFYELDHKGLTFVCVFDPRAGQGRGKVVTILDTCTPAPDLPPLNREERRLLRRRIRKARWRCWA